uniref:Sulfatase-modifying factor enzyme-like domain-containing protein n=1 Tax=Aureoumbra lagunensis TaxID=44058 RepID=A0A7S3JXE1_9STRA
MKLCVLSVILFSVRIHGEISNLVGWQPKNALRQVPRMFAGNESMFLFLGSNTTEYTSCSKLWPEIRELLRGFFLKGLFATSFLIRCNFSLSEENTIKEPSSRLDKATAMWQQQFIQGPLQARSYLALEWNGNPLNATKVTEAVINLGFAGAALLTTNASAVIPTFVNNKQSDTLVIIDLSLQGIDSKGFRRSGLPIYSLHMLDSSNEDGAIITDLWHSPIPKQSVPTVSSLFPKSKYRVLLIVDFSNFSVEDFQLYGMFSSWFSGASNYPWLALAPPANMSVVAAWTDEVEEWRQTLRERFGLSQTQPQFQQRWINAPQIMIYDRYLTADNGTKCTVDRFLDDLTERYGGVDAVLLWVPYPNIGIDSRSQFHMAQDIIEILEECVHAFQSHSVDVILPFLPWDRGTQVFDNSTNEALMIKLAERLGVTAINGDTEYGMRNSVGRWPSNWTLMPEAGTDLRESIEYMYYATEDPYRADAGLRNALSVDLASWNYFPLINPGTYLTGRAIADVNTYGNKSTGYFNASTSIPGYLNGPPLVSRAKLIDNRHNAFQCDRWAIDHKNLVHHAFFSGTGIVTWENVWGIWQGLSDYDAQAIRRYSHLFRFEPISMLIFDKDTKFQPFIFSEILPTGLYASKFNLELSNVSITLWLFLNRNEKNQTLDISVPAACLTAHCCIDIWNGRNISVNTTLKLFFEPYGYGALYGSSSDQSCPNEVFLADRRNMTAIPLYTYDTEPHLLSQSRVEDNFVPTSHFDSNNMTFISGGYYSFITQGAQVEGWGGLVGPSSYGQPDVQFEFEEKPSRWHNHSFLNLSAFFIDTYPVTNKAYLKFIFESGYKPKYSTNFLNHLKIATTNSDEQPVRYISLSDARAYCNYYNKTLPRSYQWQRVAQGPNGDRIFPWGNDWDLNAVPTPDTGFSMREPPDVGTHPLGASAEGVHDLVATIWQLTDQFCDDHTCRVIIRGGSYYRPNSAEWYLPSTYRNDEQQTLLLFSDALDRSGAIGFRCVVNSVPLAA